MTTSDDNENENLISQSREQSDIATGNNILLGSQTAEVSAHAQGIQKLYYFFHSIFVFLDDEFKFL